MEQHPIPRQITTFEFKLVGQLTVRQFLYLALASGAAVSLFFLVPKILFLNFLAATIPVLFGIGFAFVPINDRPMELWVRNLIKRLTSPTQYYFRKHNRPPRIMMGITLPPKEVMLEYLKAKQKLEAYEFTSRSKNKREEIMSGISDQTASKVDRVKTALQASKPQVKAPVVTVKQPLSAPVAQPADTTVSVKEEELAHSVLPVGGDMFTVQGLALSSNNIPLPNMLVYLRDNGKTVRIMRTNTQGALSNAIPLVKKPYSLVVEDPRKTYSFATMTIDGTTMPLTVTGQHI